PSPCGAFGAGDFAGRKRFGEIDGAVAFLDCETIQALSETRTAVAGAGGKFEACAVTGAQEEPLVLGQEMVGEGLERNELVRTAIDVSVARAFRLYNDDIEFFFARA